MGRAFPYQPGTERARSLGLLAYFNGRPDLMAPSAPINMGVGIGVVPFDLNGELTVGQQVQIFGNNPQRVRLTLKNTTNLDAAGEESDEWVFVGGRWRPPEFAPPVEVRLAYAFGRPATSRDKVLEVGETIEVTDGVPLGSIYLLALGTAGARVRVFAEQISDYGAGQ